MRAPNREPPGRHRDAEAALREARAREKEARAEADRSARYNELFAGMLGHELRNPLSAITTGASYIARLNASAKADKAAGRILLSAQRLGRMIDQLIDFTRLRTGDGLDLALTRFALDDVAREAAHAADAAHPEHTIVVDAIGDAAGSWDRERVAQILSNLLDNALQHGSPNAPVCVHIDGRAPERVVLTVENAGTLASELRPLLFEPFRGNERDPRTRGLGLGLYISREIATAHGGALDADLGGAARTIFRLTLPRNVVRPHGPPLPPLAAAP
ncbi:MAG TPA: HAMP domain-containing sensor histidine kinase [Polyangia bacterium]|nr:HAMP domain-containing sensor histidine kinase [Polyangia bacterium]